MKNRFFSIFVVAAFAAASIEALTVTTVSHVTRPSSSTYGAEQISGITYAGGDLYYAVDDNDNKLYPITLAINRANGQLASGTNGITIAAGVTMSGANDAEGCAFDPCTGRLWVSEETGARIREYDVSSGALVRTAPVPTIQQQQYVGNYSLEALTIAGDGKSMWTANEEALKVDGLLATNSVGSVVRLTKFVRNSVHDNWTADGQWAYETQPIGTAKDSNTRSGVSGLCALPDGTLLVLERRCYQGGFFPDFNIRVYQVNFSGATDIRNISSLKTATYTKTTKTLLWQYTEGSDMPNYEGICLGPRLSDGSCVIVIISDGGSYAEEGIFTLKCSGLNVRTMNFAGNQKSEPYGGPYRYVNDASITATLPGAGNLYYEAKKVVHAAWRFLNDASKRGEGSTATFTVTSDDTLVWDSTTDSSLPILDADSFEHVALGTTANPSDLPGWSGGEDGYVAAKSYSPALPPGYPLNRETHTQVLEVDGEVTRTYDTSIAGGVILDTMVCATLPTPDTPVNNITNCFIAFHFDENGHPVLQHAHRGQTARLAASRAARRAAASGEGDGSIPNIRTVLSENTYTNGQWLRLTVKVDRQSSTWCHVSIDGSACVTPGGAYQPGNPQMDGAWYRALSTNEVISAVDLKGTGAVDDVTLFTGTANDPDSEFPEFKVTDENGDRLPDADLYEWLNEKGLPLDPNADVDGDTFSSFKEYLKGTDPWEKTSHPVFPTFFFGK